MTRFFRALLTAVAVVSIVSLGAGGVVAQELPGTPTPTPEAGQNQTHERIDQDTRLISASYDDGDGTATVVIESDVAQKITVSDAGAFVEGGVVKQRTVIVSPGERVEITMPVTKSNGYTGVSIATPETLYAVPLKSQVDFFEGQSTWQTVQVAAIGGAFGVIVMAVILAWRLRDGGKSKVERLA